MMLRPSSSYFEWSHVPLVATVIVDKKYARTSINMFKIKNK